MFSALIKKNIEKQTGFAILVAVVAAGILLVVAMSIGGIALKEQTLAVSGKDSQVAFYAADSIMECTLYWDQKNGAFSPNQDGSLQTPNIGCNNNPFVSVPPVVNPLNNKIYSYSFTEKDLKLGDGSNTTCAQVVITKDTTNLSKITTTVNAYGYSTCDPSLNRLERGIVARY